MQLFQAHIRFIISKQISITNISWEIGNQSQSSLFPSPSLYFCSSGVSKRMAVLQGIWCKTLEHFQWRQQDKTLFWIGKKMRLGVFSFSACLRNKQLCHGKCNSWGGHWNAPGRAFQMSNWIMHFPDILGWKFKPWITVDIPRWSLNLWIKFNPCKKINIPR